MCVNILQNWSHIYYNHHRIIKCVGFKPIYCVINLDVDVHHPLEFLPNLIMCFYFDEFSSGIHRNIQKAHKLVNVLVCQEIIVFLN